MMCLGSPVIQIQENKDTALSVSGFLSMLLVLVLSHELQSNEAKGNTEVCNYSLECHPLKQNCL